MIALNDAVNIHKILIERFGGGEGIRDMALLESAINRPFQTFDQEELYATTLEKAAAVIESIVLNHPFVDGNKRTGYVLMRMLLLEDGFDIEATQDEKYEFVLNIANGKSDNEAIKSWIRDKIIEPNT